MDGTEAHTRPLRLFWWKATPNFGDALSPLVVSALAGRPVDHSGAGGCDLFAIGSIMAVIRRKNRDARTDGTRPLIWGSGMLAPVVPDFLEHVDIALLRGPVSAALLGVKADRYGDPGLLAADLVGMQQRGDRIGLVPHHSQVGLPEIGALAASDPAFDLIDVRDDPLSVCRRIGACAHVVASSLHGLVVADAFGVASTWADPGNQGRLKYHDYAASVGRDMIAPLEWADLRRTAARLATGPLPHADGIARARSAVIETFPVQLCASKTSAQG